MYTPESFQAEMDYRRETIRADFARSRARRRRRTARGVLGPAVIAR